MILETEIDGLRYSLDTDEQVATVKWNIDKQRTGELVIPESFFHQGIVYRVTGIGMWAFGDCSRLTAITLPESVTSIGDEAFRFCSRLTAITLPESVTSIGDNAFLCCSNLTAVYISDIAAWCNIEFSNGYSNPLCHAHNLYLNGELVTELTIPSSVTSIGGYAFANFSSLTAITIPKGVTSIGDSAFRGCSSLTAITIPEGVTSIGEWAFYNCTSLINITIPKGVTSIGMNAFSGCSRLNTITITEGVTSIGGGAFSCCSSLTDILIPKSVTSIEWYAFSRCSNLTSILIPKSVNNIGKEAFRNTGITYLTILGKPTIEREVFEGCDKLTDVYCYSEETPQAEEAFGKLNLSRITLHVPESAIEQYKNTEPWSEFGTIVAIK